VSTCFTYSQSDFNSTLRNADEQRKMIFPVKYLFILQCLYKLFCGLCHIFLNCTVSRFNERCIKYTCILYSRICWPVNPLPNKHFVKNGCFQRKASCYTSSNQYETIKNSFILINFGINVDWTIAFVTTCSISCYHGN
jgi:hypothetical protein